MKKVYLSILFIVGFVLANAQDCFWAKRAGGNQYEQGNSITVDANDNTYVIGSFYDNTITFSPYILTNHNPGSYDFFVVKYNKNGVVKWAKNYGTAEANSITSDAQGNIYITGNYASAYLVFNTDTLFSPNPGAGSLFVVKLDSLGNEKWSKTTKVAGISGSININSNAIASDGKSGIYTTGQFLCSYIIFGIDTLYNNNTSGTNIFIAKYDTAGNVLWALGSKGAGYDMGLSVAADANNVYVSGRFTSGVMKLGADSLIGVGGADQDFTIRCDNTGIVHWMRTPLGASSSYGFGITTDSKGNSYTTGMFSGSSIVFGADTLNNSVGGLFVTKYDSSGSAKWVRGTTGYASAQGFGIDCDSAGNIYVIGRMSPADTMRFGNVVLLNPAYFQNMYPIFVVKYDPLGNAVSGICSVSSPTLTGSGKGIAVAVDNSGKISGTGYFSGTVKFGNTSLTSSGSYYDFLIFHTYPFSVNVSAPALTCNGNTNGVATAIVNGGLPPLNYTWMPIGQTGAIATGLSAGTDTLKVTDASGCMQKTVFTLTQPPADSLHICLVTVDSASQYNILSWDKTSFTDVDSFIVYREIASNNYQPIAAIPYDSLSMFIDTVRTKYFPNTGDPNAGTYRYKIKAHTTCGGYTGLSPFHNTIYFLNNNGTFYWVQSYSIQGSPNPVSSYILLRDNNSNGNWQQVSSVAGTQQLVSDPLYSVYQNTATWRVQTQWNITCTPTMRMQNGALSSFNSSFSNYYSNTGIGVKNNIESSISLYPSPNTGTFIIETGSLKNSRVEIYSLLGDLVYKADLKKEKNTVVLDGLCKGTYLVYIAGESGRTVKRVVLE